MSVHLVNDIPGASAVVIDLGPVAAHTAWPAPVTVGGRQYHLVRRTDGYELLSMICPHKGGEVAWQAHERCFQCPVHGWRFDAHSGACLNTRGPGLETFEVEERGGRLLAHLPARVAAARSTQLRRRRPDDLTLSLHSHACLEILSRGRSVLFDPWLCGPAFLGSWIPYPPPVVDVETLRPDALVFTHEHSDHFHEPTLVRFDRSVPVYVPDFPNRRMVRRVAELGFHAVPMAFGETYEVVEGVEITCFEPPGFWNDSIELIEVEGFRILNTNDAGFNQRIADLVRPIDVVCAQFSPGASGYPWTWEHLSDDEKIRIMTASCASRPQLMRAMARLYDAAYLLPFASFFELWHPSHREYLRLSPRVAVREIVSAFEGEPATVLDLLPGDGWQSGPDRIVRHDGPRAEVDDRKLVVAEIQRRFDPRVFEAHYPKPRVLDRRSVEGYFRSLNEVPEIIFCEDLSFAVIAVGDDGDPPQSFYFEVRGGELRVLDGPVSDPNLEIEVPSGILGRIVSDGVSWDEAHIGYWCRVRRQPDVYNVNFWRLLQSPYIAKPVDPVGGPAGAITEATVVADLIETYGETAERVLRRYGLYCAGCHRSTQESLRHAARQHGVAEADGTRMVRELARACGGVAS